MIATETAQTARPRIIESYRNFQPPRRITKSLNALLDALPPKYLVGLQTILLTNQAALTRRQSRKRMWSRNHQVRAAECRGTYHYATKSSPASVCLYVDNILRSEEPWMRLLPLTRHAALGTVLYHEIGHHIHAVHKPVFEEKESVAEDWSDKLYVQFLRDHYWYLKPLLYPLNFFFRVFGYPKRPRR
jgi:hypothetical protein